MSKFQWRPISSAARYLVRGSESSARLLWHCAAPLAAVSMSSLAHAQVQQPPAGEPAQPAAAEGKSAQPVTKLDVVIVTANRRRELSREVPMPVSSISAEDLEKSGASTLIDYLATQPGVALKGSGGAGQGAVTIRGVSTGNEPSATVGVYIDDVAFGSNSALLNGADMALDMGLLDLNHVEVLRGPQGTLYGAGAIGGLIKYITNEPDTNTFGGKVGVGYVRTRDGQPGYTVNGVLNLPLKEDVAALRVAAFKQHAGGYVEATGSAGDKAVNRGDTTGARMALLLEPTNKLRLRLTATGQEIQREGSDFVDYDPNTGRPVRGPLLRNALKVREPNSSKIGLVSVDIEYDLGWAKINSITARQTTRTSKVQDLTDVYGPLLGDPSVQTVVLGSTVDHRKQSQEFRLSSLGDKKNAVDWLLGFYYENESGTYHQRVDSTLDTGVGPLLADAILPSTYKETAVYGNLTWNVNDKLSLTGGMRVARNKQTYSPSGDGLLVGGPMQSEGSSSETAKTYLLTARYALTPTSNAYFRAASGYRPGGPNENPSVAPFQHDTLWSYEVGYKADLLDKTLSTELSVFNIDWNQIQAPESVNGISAIFNHGRAKIKGAEASLRYRPSANWTFSTAMALIDGQALETIPDQVTAGSRLPNSPRFSANATLTHNFQWAGHTGHAGMGQRYVGDRRAGFEGSVSLPDYRLPAYSVTDFRFGMQFGAVALDVYLRNAFDRQGQNSASTSLVPLGGPVLVTPIQPRSLGFNLSMSF